MIFERQPDPPFEYAGTASRPPVRTTHGFLAAVAAATAKEEPVKEEPGLPYWELLLPWEQKSEPSHFWHPILSNRWRRRHYRIVLLEREHGIHHLDPCDVLPWVPRYTEDIGFGY